jgi:hypothetical protein
MICSLLLLLAFPANFAPDVAVVCPMPFRAELAPWVEHRTKQGRVITWVDSQGSAADIHRRLAEIAKKGSLRFVVLVGDVPGVSPTGVPVSSNTVSTHFVPAKVNIRWGSEPEIASDHSYADFDGDQLPDVAIGRLPADSVADVRTLVRKILAYESSVDYGQWRRRINFVAGVGGFGALADAVIESAAKRLITESVPAGYSTSMTYGSWRSPYCPDPREFRDATLNTLNQGSLFWIYIGHGHRRTVDAVRVPGGAFPIFSDADVPSLQCRSGAPIACFLACSAGEFDHAEDCLAEEMLRAPSGPIAVYAGSRTTMPYAMAVMGLGMLETCFGATPAQTLGEAVLHTKRMMMATDNLAPNRKALDSIATLVSPAPADLAAERREHLYLFNLLGDPLLRLPQPHRLELVGPLKAKAGETITIKGLCDIGGIATVELIVRRDRLTFKPQIRSKFEPTNLFLSHLSETYQKANNPCIHVVKVPLAKDGRFQCSFSVPGEISGPCHVRAFVEGGNACALGHCDLELN